VHDEAEMGVPRAGAHVPALDDRTEPRSEEHVVRKEARGEFPAEPAVVGCPSHSLTGTS
jgi:hypothetical protein